MKLKLSEAVSYRVTWNEVVVVDTENAGIFYFTKDSKDFFDFFSEPRKVEDFATRLATDDEELPAPEYLAQFTQFLLANELVKPVTDDAALALPDTLPKESPRPVFLRQTVFDNRLTANLSTIGLSAPIIVIC